MKEQTRAKVIRTIMNGATIYTVLCWVVVIITLGFGISGTPIPWVDAIVLLALEIYLSMALYKYHTEWKYGL